MDATSVGLLFNAFQKPHVFSGAFSHPSPPPKLSSLRALARFKWQSHAPSQCLNLTDGLVGKEARLWPFALWRGRLQRLMSELISINLSLFPIKPAKQPEQQSLSTCPGMTQHLSEQRAAKMWVSRVCLLRFQLLSFFSVLMSIIYADVTWSSYDLCQLLPFWKLSFMHVMFLIVKPAVCADLNLAAS